MPACSHARDAFAIDILRNVVVCAQYFVRAHVLAKFLQLQLHLQVIRQRMSVTWMVNGRAGVGRGAVSFSAAQCTVALIPKDVY